MTLPKHISILYKNIFRNFVGRLFWLFVSLKNWRCHKYMWKASNFDLFYSYRGVRLYAQIAVISLANVENLFEVLLVQRWQMTCAKRHMAQRSNAIAKGWFDLDHTFGHDLSVNNHLC